MYNPSFFEGYHFIQLLSDVYVYIDSMMFNCHMAWSKSSEQWVWLFEAGSDQFKDDSFFVLHSLFMALVGIRCNSFQSCGSKTAVP